MLKTIIGVVCFFFLQSSSAQNENKLEFKNVLFVGNSLTKYEKNQTLFILNKFLEESNNDLHIGDHTYNGALLWNLMYNKTTSKRKGIMVSDYYQSDLYQKMQKTDYDLIIVQQDSYDSLPGIDLPEARFRETLPIFDRLMKSEEIPVVVFERYGPFINKMSKHKNESYFENKYQSLLLKKQQLRDSIPDLKFIPTAYIIKEYRTTYPKARSRISGNHPSKNIQFLLACVFYKFLTGKNALDLIYAYKLNDLHANEIKSLSDRAYSSFYTEHDL